MLRGIRYDKLSGLEKLVMYQAYTQERMADMNRVAATVFAATDPKKASEFLGRCMDELFPEIALHKDLSVEAKQRELDAFTKKKISLVPIAGSEGLQLSISDKE